MSDGVQISACNPYIFFHREFINHEHQYPQPLKVTGTQMSPLTDKDTLHIKFGVFSYIYLFFDIYKCIEKIEFTE